MKVIYICADPGIPVWGQKGCSIHVQEVIRAFQKQGAMVELIASKLGGEPPKDLTNLTVYPLPKVEKKIDLAQREQKLLALNCAISKILEAVGPYDLIYERYSLWSYAGMEVAHTQGVPGFLEVNAPLIEEQAKHRGLINHHKAQEIASRAFQQAAQLIAVSQEVKRYLMGWISSDRVQVIPNGVDVSRFSPRADRSLDSTFTVGFVGTLKPWHGLGYLVDAFAQLQQRVSQGRLLIVGDGPQRSALEQHIFQRGLEASVQWTGAVPPAHIPDWLNQMNVAVAPYPPLEDFYFSPLKVMEYMAAGLPVVASKIGQIEDIIADEVTGLFCSPGESNQLAKTLERLWRSPYLCRRLGSSARQQVIAHYTWDSVVQRILTLALSSQTPEPPQSQQTLAPGKVLIHR